MVSPQNSEIISPCSNEFFNNQWIVYQKILKGNYMGHREIYDVLHQLLINYFQKPFKILELGCGDASFSSQALSNTLVESYKGVDLSQTALEIATSNMAQIQCSQSFIEGDFSKVVSELVKNQQGSFDAILISFALHHLLLEQKDSIIGDFSNLLTADGVFILIDVCRKQEEDRGSYITRYLEDIEQNWSLISPKEYLLLADHIRLNDFPESQETLHEIAQKHNFNRFECLYRDRLDTTQLLCFYR